MKNKKQMLGLSLLIVLSVAFILCCLFLPLVYVELHDFTTEELIVPLSKNYNLIEFIKLAGNEFLFFLSYDAAGPMWLTIATMFFNIFTLVGCVFVLVLSIVGLIFAIANKPFGFKNSAIYKVASFVGGFAVLSFVFQMVGSIVLTSMAKGLLIFNMLYGCFINLGLGVCILVSSIFVKNKEGVLNKNKIRDAIFFALTAVASVGFAVMLIFCAQFANEPFMFLYGE